MQRFLLALLWLLVCPLAGALETGQPLPELQIIDPGEMLLEQQGVRFVPWHSKHTPARVQVLQYLAARSSARQLNHAFTERLKQADIAVDRYHVTTIVNLDDALFGSRRFVMAELEANKRRYFLSSIVADADGAGLRAWRLRPRSSAIIIVGGDGHVRFFRDGALSEPEIETALALIRAEIATAATAGSAGLLMGGS